MIRQMLSTLLTRNPVHGFRSMFDDIIGYDGIKRTFIRSLNSEQPVHLLLVGPPGQAKNHVFEMHIGDVWNKKRHSSL